MTLSEDSIMESNLGKLILNSRGSERQPLLQTLIRANSGTLKISNFFEVKFAENSIQPRSEIKSDIRLPSHEGLQQPVQWEMKFDKEDKLYFKFLRRSVSQEISDYFRDRFLIVGRVIIFPILIVINVILSLIIFNKWYEVISILIDAMSLFNIYNKLLKYKSYRLARNIDLLDEFKEVALYVFAVVFGTTDINTSLDSAVVFIWLTGYSILLKSIIRSKGEISSIVISNYHDYIDVKRQKFRYGKGVTLALSILEVVSIHFQWESTNYLTIIRRLAILTWTFFI